MIAACQRPAGLVAGTRHATVAAANTLELKG